MDGKEGDGCGREGSDDGGKIKQLRMEGGGRVGGWVGGVAL